MGFQAENGVVSRAGTPHGHSIRVRSSGQLSSTKGSVVGVLLCFSFSLPKLIMCTQKLAAESKEIHNQPRLALQGFAAGSGSSCWLTSVSPLPLQAGAAPGDTSAWWQP